MEISYNELYKINKIEARRKLINIYLETKSIRRTAKILDTSRFIVRKFIKRYNKDGDEGLEDKSRKPKVSPKQTARHIEEKVIKQREKSNMGIYEIAKVLEREANIKISPYTIRNILKRYKYTKKKRKRAKYGKSMYVDYAEIKELQYFQIDTKDILDYKALPREAYMNFLRKNELPKYQFSAIDVKSRIKYISYGYSKNQMNGIYFMMLVGFWIRMRGYKHKLYFQTDWGSEYGGFSKRKLEGLKKRYFEPMGIEHWHSRKGKWWDNAYVERSHLTDDQLLYVPYGAKIKDKEELIEMARKYMYYYNVMRPHMGKGMNFRSPYDKLKSSRRYRHERESIVKFPVIILDKYAVDFFLEYDKLLNTYPGNDVSAHD